MIGVLRAEIDGTPATVDQLHRMAVTNYGHFTSMQVRGGAVRGIDPHVRRWEESSPELFGQAVDGSPVFDGSGGRWPGRRTHRCA
ncbi:MAG TPA: hypothetical protein VGX25_14390 [Actinophytocola sp.]|uniref:hypothetical protein n=1 Tax=Actinophytocola sp. TaxID=1872138 RepID=UPI002DDCD623|nr:hypothetical protein [Actinophytocola sp.]HEV2780576.1 hypothetical protein [Actinophytocola sp.]